MPLREAPELRLDHISDLSFEEVDGVIRRLTRRALVLGFDGTKSYHRLWEACNYVGVPQIGSGLTGNPLLPDTANIYAHLVCVARKPKVLMDPFSFEVILEYDHILDGPHQNLNNPYPFGVIRGKTKCSVQQKPTNFFRRNPATIQALSLAGMIANPNIGNPYLAGWGTGEKELITVRHTWPRNDPHHRSGQTEVQGGEVTIYQPHRTLHFSGYYKTAAPWMLADNIIASINSLSWVNHGPGEWMCTEVAWEYQKNITKVINQYKFEVEFQHDPDGWDPTAVFIDRHTQRPPAGLVKDRGYKVIPYHKPLNFNVVFQALFEGWQQVFVGALFGI